MSFIGKYLPHFSYASLLANGMGVKILLDAPPDSPYQPLFQELGWLYIYERIQYHKGILLHKIVYGMRPQYMSDIFTFANSNTYILRSIDNQDNGEPKT